MGRLSRRTVLAGGVALAAAATLPAYAQSKPSRPALPFLRSDIGTLKRVLVHAMSPDEFLVWRHYGSLLPNADLDDAAAITQYAELTKLLGRSGCEIVQLKDALDGAISATRRSGVFGAWLDATFPLLGADPDRVTSTAILARDRARHFGLGPNGDYRFRTDSGGSTIFTRDSAFMTPRGLVICNSRWPNRRQENAILRFVYAHSPLLNRYPVVFDAVEENYLLEGGDACVMDESTLVLGVGSISDPRVAPVLAQRLDMDVLAVTARAADFTRPFIPGQAGAKDSALGTLLLHLDTNFTLIGPRHALAVPYLYEQAYAESSPLCRFVRGARADTHLTDDAADAALARLKAFGRVRLWKRGTGAEEKLGEVKLVDHLRDRGFRFTWVGGPRPSGDAEAFRHFMSVTYPEHYRQAANVVQAQPGRVITFAGNPATEAALKADGIAVDSFAGRDLWPMNGGPHCLTQPLERS